MSRVLRYGFLFPPFIILLPYLYLSDSPSLANDIVRSGIYFFILMAVLLLYAPIVYPLFFLIIFQHRRSMDKAVRIIGLSLASVGVCYIAALFIMSATCTSVSCFDGDPFSVSAGVILFLLYNLVMTAFTATGMLLLQGVVNRTNRSTVSSRSK